MATFAAIDIGNTSTTVALFKGRRLIRRVFRDSGEWNSESRIQTTLERLGRGAKIDGSVLCSVVPELSYRWVLELTDHIGVHPIVVTNESRLGVVLDYPRPDTLGPDRLADLCGAAAWVRPPVIVADFGTAATFDVIDAEGRFIGGVIAPGPGMMAACLHEHTALLPSIRLSRKVPAIGRDTVSAMQCGVQVGYRGLIREIVSSLRGLPGMRCCRLVATGGYAERSTQGTRLPWRLDPDLTLKGLARIYELNSQGGL